MSILYIIAFLLCLYASEADYGWVNKHYGYGEECVLLNELDSNNMYAVMGVIGNTVVYRSTDQGENWTEVFRRDHYNNFGKDSVLNVTRASIPDTNHFFSHTQKD